MISGELEKIRSMVKEAIGATAVEVYLFGSRARGDARPGSDVDLAIDHAERLPAGTLPRLREALEEAPILAQVDLVDLADAGPGLRRAVVREGIRWNP